MHTSQAPAPTLGMPILIKCFNRAPYQDTVSVQSGWTDDGRRRMITIPNPMSKSCRFDQKLVHEGCKGCRWQLEDDPRDAA